MEHKALSAGRRRDKQAAREGQVVVKHGAAPVLCVQDPVSGHSVLCPPVAYGAPPFPLAEVRTMLAEVGAHTVVERTHHADTGDFEDFMEEVGTFCPFLRIYGRTPTNREPFATLQLTCEVEQTVDTMRGWTRDWLATYKGTCLFGASDTPSREIADSLTEMLLCCDVDELLQVNACDVP